MSEHASHAYPRDLAEACTAETFGLVLDWLSSTRRASVATKRNYVDDLRRVWILRRYLQDLSPVEIMEFLTDKFKGTKNNKEFLDSMNG